MCSYSLERRRGRPVPDCVGCGPEGNLPARRDGADYHLGRVAGSAAFEAAKGCAISLYLDLDPSVSPTAGEASTRLNSLLDEGAKADGANKRALTHDQRRGLKADFDRIRSYFANEFSRDGAHGLAVFTATMDNVWRPLPLTESVPDEVRVGRQLYLAPARAAGRSRGGALVVVVGREEGCVLPVAGRSPRGARRPARRAAAPSRSGRLVAVSLPAPRRQARGRASARRRRGARPPGAPLSRSSVVVVIAPEDAWARFSDLLSQDARGAIIGWTTRRLRAGA